MLRSTLALAFSALVVFAVAACAKTSDNPPVVTAPLASATAQAAPGTATAGATAMATDASVPPDADTSGAAAAEFSREPDAGAAAAFQACQVDSDCVAVPRNGCCNNGWKEAVNVAQKDAYAASFTCPHRHPCPMYMVRDQRVPRCDTNTHLCAMVRAQP
jgi:hypothetical protein